MRFAAISESFVDDLTMTMKSARIRENNEFVMLMNAVNGWIYRGTATFDVHVYSRNQKARWRWCATYRTETCRYSCVF